MRCLIDQPAGLGDILFTQKIAKVYGSAGYEIIWPVKENLLWLNDYLDTICDNNTSYKFISVDDKHSKPTVILSLDGCTNKTPGRIMKTKYDVAGLDYSDYVNYMGIKINREKAFDLYYKIIDSQKISSYILSCPYIGTPNSDGSGMIKYNIPIPKLNTLPVIELAPIEGYTLFDWYYIILHSSGIYAMDSSINFLLEEISGAFDTTLLQNLHLFSRRGHFNEVEYLFNVPWNYHNGLIDTI